MLYDSLIQEHKQSSETAQLEVCWSQGQGFCLLSDQAQRKLSGCEVNLQSRISSVSRAWTVKAHVSLQGQLSEHTSFIRCTLSEHIAKTWHRSYPVNNFTFPFPYNTYLKVWAGASKHRDGTNHTIVWIHHSWHWERGKNIQIRIEVFVYLPLSQSKEEDNFKGEQWYGSVWLQIHYLCPMAEVK